MRSTTLPPTTDAALGPSRAPAVLPLQLKVFGVLSFILFPTCLPSSSDRCLLLLKVGCESMIRVPGLCPGGDSRETEPVALLRSDVEESTRDPTACGQQLPVFPSPAAVCVGVCVWIFICVPCTRECMNWRE